MNLRHLLIAIYLLLPLLFWHEAKSATSNLTLTSGNTELNEGFVWARDLALTYVATGRPGVPYPCYQGSYANDFQYCIRDISHQVEAGHLLGLDTENFSMLKKFAESANKNTDSCRKRWPFWKFEFGGKGSNFTPELPTPFELSERAFEQYLWTGNRQWIDDPVFNEFFEYTNKDRVTYLDANKNGIIDIATLQTKCKDGMASYWEFQNTPSNESGDAIGSQYQSYLGYAKILESKGNKAEADIFKAKAEELKVKFERDWYSESAGRYISGFTKNGTPLTDWAHEMSLFILLKRITDMGPRTQNFIDFVHSTTYNEGINIETTTYYPEALYHHNANHLGWHWLLYGLRSRNIYPEVSYLAVRNTICGLMGVSPDAPNSRVITLSRLVNDVPWAEVDHIPVGVNDLKLRHDGQYKTTLTNNSGPSINWEIQFYGNYPNLIVDGTTLATRQKMVNGTEVSYVEVSVRRGATVVARIPETTTPEYVYLSDLTQKSGEARKDVCGNGYVMTLTDPYKNGQNKTYTKGLGMANSQQITYQLGGKYFLFISDIGMDLAKKAQGGAEGQHGTTQFKVYADNKEIYSSAAMEAKSNTESIILNVAGVQELRLETVASGFSYPNWADAKLSTKPAAFLNINFDSVANDTNNDGLADPGETLDLKLNLSNMGKLASGSNTILKCTAVGETASLVTINTPSIHIGSIGADTQQDKLVNIKVSENATKGTRLEFIFELTDGVATGKLVHQIFTPHAVLDVLYKRLTDNSLPSKSDNQINPGDEGYIEVVIKNSGTSSSEALKLECKATGANAEYLTLPQGVHTLAALAKGAEVVVPVRYALSAGTPGKRDITFSFTLYDNNGEKQVKTIEKKFVTPSASYKIKFNAIDNLFNGLNMVCRGRRSNLTVEVENNGDVTGDKAMLEISKIEDNVEFYHMNNQVFDLGKLEAGQKMTQTIPIDMNWPAPAGGVISMSITVNDGAVSSTIIKRFVIGAVYCSDMPFVEISEYNEAGRDTKVMGFSAIKLAGQTYIKGIGTHAISEIEIPLDGKYTRFTSVTGIDEAIISNGSCAFKVYVDEDLRWESDVLKAGGNTATCDVDVTNGQILKLMVTDGGDGINSDHADWADARLLPLDEVSLENQQNDDSKLTISPSVCRHGDLVYANLTQPQAGETQLSVYDKTGVLILTNNFYTVEGLNKIAIETYMLSSGMYLIKTQGSDGEIHTQKLILY